jgi:hypothetical protein
LLDPYINRPPIVDLLRGPNFAACEASAEIEEDSAGFNGIESCSTADFNSIRDVVLISRVVRMEPQGLKPVLVASQCEVLKAKC